MTEVRKRSAAKRPHHPSPCTQSDIYALKALAEGVANDIQQKRALAWILNEGCGIRNNTYYADSERDTVFACGRRFVGLEIVALINMPNAKLENLSHD